MSTRLPGANYKSVFDRGRSLKGRLMSVWVVDSPNADFRVGVIVSRKSFHDAVDRNRAKRIMREGFRLALEKKWLSPSTWILAGRATLRNKRTQDVMAELRYLARKAGVLCKYS